MNLAFASLGLLMAAALGTSVAPSGNVIHYSYAEYVGPVYVSGHGYIVHGPQPWECSGWGEASMFNPGTLHGAHLFPTEERPTPCGPHFIAVYLEPVKGSCDYLCQTGHKPPYTPEEVKANWTLIAGPVQITP